MLWYTSVLGDAKSSVVQYDCKFLRPITRLKYISIPKKITSMLVGMIGAFKIYIFRSNVGVVILNARINIHEWYIEDCTLYKN